MATLFQIDFKYTDFEPISETSESQLIGGFSTAISILPGTPFAVEDNNCNGGNCVSGCGTGQNVSSCNTTMGCGKP